MSLVGWKRLSVILAVLLGGVAAMLVRQLTLPAPAPAPALAAPAPALAAPAGLAPGSNEMLRQPLASIPGIEVIVSDVIIPAGSQVPHHYHPGEEFAYVVDGSAIHIEEGKPVSVVKAGDSFTILPESVHAPRGGPAGARVIVFRVHRAGLPERIPVPRPD